MKNELTVRSFINYHKLNKSLQLERWSTIFEGINVDDMTDNFISTLVNAVKNCTHDVKRSIKIS